MLKARIDLTPDDIKKIQRMAGLGLKVEQMAAVLGMSKKTFERRMKDTKGAADALEKGRAVAVMNVSETAYELATSRKHPIMTMFWLKCQGRWKEVQPVEISGPNGQPIETRALEKMTDEELKAKKLELLAKDKTE